MYNAKITGIASYVPDYKLTNDELSQMVDTNDEWITTRVGIKERRILKGEGLGSSYMGKIAVDRLMESTGANRDEIDLVICATSNPDYRFGLHVALYYGSASNSGDLLVYSIDNCQNFGIRVGISF